MSELRCQVILILCFIIINLFTFNCFGTFAKLPAVSSKISSSKISSSNVPSSKVPSSNVPSSKVPSSNEPSSNVSKTVESTPALAVPSISSVGNVGLSFGLSTIDIMKKVLVNDKIDFWAFPVMLIGYVVDIGSFFLLGAYAIVSKLLLSDFAATRAQVIASMDWIVDLFGWSNGVWQRSVALAMISSVAYFIFAQRLYFVGLAYCFWNCVVPIIRLSVKRYKQKKQ